MVGVWMVTVIVAVLAVGTEAFVPCTIKTCDVTTRTVPVETFSLDCGSIGLLIADAELREQEAPLECSADTSAGIDTESLGNATVCNLTAANLQIRELCNDKEECSVKYADLNLTTSCASAAADGYVALTGTCAESGFDLLPVLVTFVTALISFGMGVSVEPDEWLRVLKQEWKGTLVGFLCQYGFMPLLGFSIAKIFFQDLPPLVSVGLVICGSVPGGSTSNLMTFLADGNVALSMIMSSASGLASLVFIPLTTFLYINLGLDVDANKFPWGSLFISIATVVIPPFLGYLYRKHLGHKMIPIICSKGKKVPLHKLTSTVGTVVGLLFLAVAIYVGITDNPVYFNQPKETQDAWLVGMAFQPIGCLIGYFVSWLCRFKPKECRAICLETGIQNTTVAIQFITLAWTGCQRYYGLYFTLLISLWLVINSFIVAGVLKVTSKWDPVEKDSGEEHEDEFYTAENLVRMEVVAEKGELKDDHYTAENLVRKA